MNLLQAKAMTDVASELMRASVDRNGGLLLYNPFIHVKVSPADFEGMTAEQYPEKVWTSPGHKPWISHRFARYSTRQGSLTVSCDHDYTKE